MQLISTCLSRIYSLHPEDLPQVSVIVKEGNVGGVPCIRWVGCQERAAGITAQISVFLSESISPIYHQPLGTEREQQASLLKYRFDSLPGSISSIYHQPLDSQNVLPYSLGMVSKVVILAKQGFNQGWEASRIQRCSLMSTPCQAARYKHLALSSHHPLKKARIRNRRHPCSKMNVLSPKRFIHIRPMPRESSRHHCSNIDWINIAYLSSTSWHHNGLPGRQASPSQDNNLVYLSSTDLGPRYR